jgi:hypothetical protein
MPICCVTLILRHCGVLTRYASFLRISEALHLDIFHQPPMKVATSETNSVVMVME